MPSLRSYLDLNRSSESLIRFFDLPRWGAETKQASEEEEYWNSIQIIVSFRGNEARNAHIETLETFFAAWVEGGEGDSPHLPPAMFMMRVYRSGNWISIFLFLSLLVAVGAFLDFMIIESNVQATANPFSSTSINIRVGVGGRRFARCFWFYLLHDVIILRRVLKSFAL